MRSLFIQIICFSALIAVLSACSEPDASTALASGGPEDVVTLDLPLPTQMEKKSDDLTYPLRDQLLARLTAHEAVPVSDLLDVIFENQTQRHRFFRDVRSVNQKLDGLVTSSTDPSILKQAYEKHLEQGKSDKLKVNSVASSIEDIFKDFRLNDYSATILNVAIYKKSLHGNLDRERKAVVIFTGGQMMPGFLLGSLFADRLYGIDVTARGSAVIDFGFVNDLLGIHRRLVRIVPVNDFLLSEAIKTKLDLSQKQKQDFIRASVEKLSSFKYSAADMEEKIRQSYDQQLTYLKSKPWRSQRAADYEETSRFQFSNSLRNSPFDVGLNAEIASDVALKQFEFKATATADFTPQDPSHFLKSAPKLVLDNSPDKKVSPREAAFHLDGDHTLAILESAGSFEISIETLSSHVVRKTQVAKTIHNVQVIHFLQTYLESPLSDLEWRSNTIAPTIFEFRGVNDHQITLASGPELYLETSGIAEAIFREAQLKSTVAWVHNGNVQYAEHGPFLAVKIREGDGRTWWTTYFEKLIGSEIYWSFLPTTHGLWTRPFDNGAWPPRESHHFGSAFDSNPFGHRPRSPRCG